MYSRIRNVEAIINYLLVVIFGLILSLIITFKIRHIKLSGQMQTIIKLLSVFLALVQNKSLERAKKIMEFDT